MRVVAIFAQTQISATPTTKRLTVDDAPEMEVYSFGKSVIVKKQAKGVLAFGGDVIIEGRVEGDVATIGGSVIQKEGPISAAMSSCSAAHIVPKAKIPCVKRANKPS